MIAQHQEGLPLSSAPSTRCHGLVPGRRYWQRRLYPNVTYGEYGDKPGKSSRSPALDEPIITLCTVERPQGYRADLDV